MNKTDRRIEKTRNAIYEAFNELLREKRYTNITIQEIIDKANIGRTTFYAHFPTKDDLLSSCVENILESFDMQLSEPAKSEHGNHLISVAALFNHVKENEHMIRGIIMSDSGEFLLERLKKYWSIQIEPRLSAHIPIGSVPKVPLDVLMNHIANTLISLIRYWLQSKTACTPEKMEEYFYNLIIPAVQSGTQPEEQLKWKS